MGDLESIPAAAHSGTLCGNVLQETMEKTVCSSAGGSSKDFSKRIPWKAMADTASLSATKTRTTCSATTMSVETMKMASSFGTKLKVWPAIAIGWKTI